MITTRALRRIRHHGSRALALDTVLSLFVGGPGVLTAALTALFWVLLAGILAAVATLWWRLGTRRWWILGGAKHTAYLQACWRDVDQRAQTPGIELVHIARITQRARTGTKAIVRHRDGATQDAWFWNVRVQHRSILLVRANTGYGPHTRRDHVLYIGTKDTGSGIVATIPHAVWRAGHQRA
jgi:hypothetical protein